MRDNKIQVAAYYFPNWHPDPMNEKVHGKGWTEWEVVKCARPRFEGHRQPKVPLWGYEDESAPEAMNRKIRAAREHGVDAFIFDYYYYDEGPFRERCLREGFLKAPELGDFRFAVMWCNHLRGGLHPAPYTMKVETFSPASVSPETFDRLTDRIAGEYFTHPNYWKIGGKPFFSVYAIGNLIRNFGGVEQCAEALERVREKTRRAGFPDFFFVCNQHALAELIDRIEGRKEIEPDSGLTSFAGKSRAELIRTLGIAAAAPYSYWEHAPFEGFPRVDGEAIRRGNTNYWFERAGEFGIPYFPTVETGWDSSPRTVQSDMFEHIGYPWMGVMEQTPEEFRNTLEAASGFLLSRPPEERIVTLSTWNEWTEGAYLEPDQEHGYAMLEAVRTVFGTH